ncbi:MAG: SRPBCC family protein [Gallionella sp.]
MNFLRNLCLVAGSLLIQTSTPADEIFPTTTKVAYQDSKLVITASVILPVEPCATFELLTDYDSIPSYMPGVLETHHENIEDGVVKVWQTGEVKLLVFHFKVNSLLEVHEVRNKAITFKQLDGNLASYSGAWTLSDDIGGTKVLYRAELTFKHFMPIFLARVILDDEIKLRFSAIAGEAARRTSKGQLVCRDRQDNRDSRTSPNK